MASNPPTVSDQQLALFKEHVALQRDELAEQREKNRADEAIEMRRISAEVETHEKNLEHAGKVLIAQGNDRRELRTFWTRQFQNMFYLIVLIVVLGTAITCFAIYKGQSKEVFDAIVMIASYLIAVLGGIGLDRAWIHRKKSGITPTDSQG